MSESQRQHTATSVDFARPIEVLAADPETWHSLDVPPPTIRQEGAFLASIRLPRSASADG